MNDTTTIQTEWSLYGTVEIDGTVRGVWHHEDTEGRDVFQMTEGDEPINRSGYHLLETLLSLKDVKSGDFVPLASRPRSTERPRL